MQKLSQIKYAPSQVVRLTAGDGGYRTLGDLRYEMGNYNLLQHFGVVAARYGIAFDRRTGNASRHFARQASTDTPGRLTHPLTPRRTTVFVRLRLRHRLRSKRYGRRRRREHGHLELGRRYFNFGVWLRRQNMRCRPPSLCRRRARSRLPGQCRIALQRSQRSTGPQHYDSADTARRSSSVTSTTNIEATLSSIAVWLP